MREPEVVLGVAVLVGVVIAPSVPWWWVAALPVPLVLLWWWPRWGAAWVGLCVGLGAVHGLPQGPVFRDDVVVHGVIVGAPVGRTADMAVARAAVVGEPWSEVSGRVRLTFGESTPRLGSEVVAWGDAREPDGAVLPGAPSGLRGVPRARLRTLVKVREHAVVGPAAPRHVPGRHSAVLRALALGDRQGLADDTVAVLRGTGTSHVLAISGFHVGLVAGVVWSAYRGVVALFAVVRQRGLPAWPGWVAGASVAWAYAWAVGAPVSAQRAALLLAVVAALRLFGARARVLSVLALAVALVLVLDPAAVDSPSFQLSFAAVVGMVRLMPTLQSWQPWWWPERLGVVWSSLCVSTSATLGTLPVAGWWFQHLPPLSPLANVVAVPVVAFALAPLSAVACWLPEPVAGWAALTADPVIDVLIEVLRLFAVPPFTPAWGPAVVVVLMLLLLLPRRVAGCAALLALGLSAHGGAPASLRVTFLDVSQGDATLVEHADGRRWLVDGGPPGKRVLHWLRRRGIRHLHAVVATHDQADHTGGLSPVLEHLRVDELWVAGFGEVPDLEALAVSRGVTVRVPGEAIAQSRRAELPNPNDRSVVLAPGVDDVRVLLLGDLERAGERLLLDDLPTWTPVVKAGHHGSRTSSGEAIVQATQPRLVVVSAGRHNRYGHPHAEVVHRWRDAGAMVLRTDKHGTIEVELTADRLAVRAWTVQHGWRSYGAWPTQSWAWGAKSTARVVR